MNILLTSHGGLCTGMLDAFQMFASGATHISAVSLTDTGIDDFRDRLTARVNELLTQGDLLILADLAGGTPFNESYALFLNNPEHIRLVAGANFPMLLEAGVLAMSSDDLDAVTTAALTAGPAGVIAAEMPADSSDDEDDLF